MAMVEVDANLSGIAVLEEGGDSCNAHKAPTTIIRYPQGGSRGLHRSSSIAAKPPILMAAMFPWNRERESRTEKTHGIAEASEVPVLIGEGGVTAGKFAVKPSMEKKVTTQASSKEKGNRLQMSVVGDIIVFFQDSKEQTIKWKLEDGGANVSFWCEEEEDEANASRE